MNNSVQQEQLLQLLQREKLLSKIAQRIRQSLKLEEVLQTAVEEVRQMLQTDRVLLYQFTTNWGGSVVVESVGCEWTPILGKNIQDTCFQENYVPLYRNGRVRAIEDIYTAGLTPCYLDLLSQFQIRANLVIPVIRNNQLWGLLIAQHCRNARKWEDSEIELLNQLSVQLAIAIQQAGLYEQLQAELKIRRATYAALQASEERFRAVVCDAPLILLSLDEQGKIQLLEGKNLNSLGATSSEVIGQSVFQVYRHLPSFLDDVRQALSGKAFTSVLEIGHLTFEIRYSPLRQSNNSINSITIVAIDITERRQAEEALRQSEILRQSEAKTRTLLNAIPDAIFRIHRDGTCLDFKPSKDEAQYREPDTVIGQHITKILPAQVAEKFLLYLRLAFSTRETQLFDYQLQDYGQHDYEARVVINDLDEVLIAVRDISERKKVERLKNEFVSTVSHELRTPLTSIRGSLGLITGGVAGEISPQAKTLIDIAYKNSERLILLINDILDIEKIESGKLDFILQPQELMPLVERAIESNRVYGEQLGVTFHLTQTLPKVKVNVDGERLIQVLTNFLSNAAKFSPTQETVDVAVTHHQQSIRIAVTDRGPGIPEEFRNRIFQKFAQADSSDARQKGGTGLGLSISKAIVERLNGKIGFETDTGIGTTFYCDLPEWCEEKDIIDIASKAPSSLRILVCEDEPDIALVLKMMLQQAHFQIDIAHNATQAKQLLAKNHYAAMTLDLALPEQSGIDLIKELRNQVSTQNLPIVVISANAQQGRQELQDVDYAIIDWLDKPINQERLIAVCQQATAHNLQRKPRILHIEDNIDVLQVVTLILKNIAEVEYASNLKVAQQKLTDTIFDLVILDLCLPDGSGLEILPLVNNSTEIPTPVVLFTAKDVSAEAACQVTTALIKSRTSNQKLLDTIKSLVNKE